MNYVVVAIPYFISACAQFTYLVSGRRHIEGWALARNMTIAVLGGMFAMWVTFSSGYLAVYQTVLLLMVGVPLYSFLKARRERLGMVEAPIEVPSDLSSIDAS